MEKIIYIFNTQRSKKAYYIRRFSLISVFVFLSLNINGQVNDSTQIYKTKVLKGIVVKGKNSLTKTRGNAVVYKAQVLNSRYAPSTAYDLLTKVPSVTDSGNSISLIGANNLMVIIDGKATTMEQEQVYQELKSLSPDKVKSIEINYNAPAKYHFNGAVINIVTIIGEKKDLSMFVDGSISRTRKYSTDDKTSLLWSNKKATSFTSIGYTHNNEWGYSDCSLFPNNSFLTPYRTRYAEHNSHYNKYNISEDLSFNMSSENKLNIDYYGVFDNNNTLTKSIINQNSKNTNTLSEEYTKETLHTIGIQADLKYGWSLGARYKSFTSPYTQKYIAVNEDEPLILPDNYLQKSKQNVENIKANIDKAFTFSQASSLSVGYNHQFNRVNTNITDGDSESRNKQTENIESFYAQGNFTMFKEMSVMLGIRSEYINSKVLNKVTDLSSTLWDEFNLFPTATISLPLKRDFIQFQLISQKQYPSFWAVSPETTIIDEKTLETGNTALKPSRIYDMSLMYILHQKWFFILGCTYTPDYFANIPHQDTKIQKTVYRYENYDYSLFNSFTIMHPISFGNYNGRVAAHLLRMQDKMDNFYGSSFNNEKWVWAASINNTYKIPLGKTLGNLFIEANFRYQSPAIQGVYKISDTYALNTDARWNLTDRISITASVDNVLRRATSNEFKVTTQGQESILHGYNTRTAMLKVTVNLGKRTDEKEEEAVDISRFGRGK